MSVQQQTQEERLRSGHRRDMISIRKPTKLDIIRDSVPKPKEILPSNPLPLWKSIPLEQKIPAVPCPDGEFHLSRNPLGESIFLSEAEVEFDMLDPFIKETPIGYEPLHDPNLKYFFQKNPGIVRKLQDLGMINDAGEVTCTLSDFNKYRLYISRLHKSKINEEQAKQSRMEEADMEKTKKIKAWLSKESRDMRIKETLIRREDIEAQSARRRSRSKSRGERQPNWTVKEERARAAAEKAHKKNLHQFKTKIRLDQLKKAQLERLRQMITKWHCEEQNRNSLRKATLMHRKATRQAELGVFVDSKRAFQEKKIRYERAILQKYRAERACQIAKREEHYKKMEKDRLQEIVDHDNKEREKGEREMYLLKKYSKKWMEFVIAHRFEYGSFQMSLWSIRQQLRVMVTELKEESGAISFTSFIQGLIKLKPGQKPVPEMNDETKAIINYILDLLIRKTLKEFSKRAMLCHIDMTSDEYKKKRHPCSREPELFQEDFEPPKHKRMTKPDIPFEKPFWPCHGPCTKFRKQDCTDEEWRSKCNEMAGKLKELHDEIADYLKDRLLGDLNRAAAAAIDNNKQLMPYKSHAEREKLQGPPENHMPKPIILSKPQPNKISNHNKPKYISPYRQNRFWTADKSKPKAVPKSDRSHNSRPSTADKSKPKTVPKSDRSQNMKPSMAIKSKPKAVPKSDRSQNSRPSTADKSKPKTVPKPDMSQKNESSKVDPSKPKTPTTADKPHPIKLTKIDKSTINPSKKSVPSNSSNTSRQMTPSKFSVSQPGTPSKTTDQVTSPKAKIVQPTKPTKPVVPSETKESPDDDISNTTDLSQQPTPTKPDTSQQISPSIPAKSTPTSKPNMTQQTKPSKDENPQQLTPSTTTSKMGQKLTPSKADLSPEISPSKTMQKESATKPPEVSQQAKSSKAEMGQPSTPSTADVGDKTTKSKSESTKPTPLKVEGEKKVDQSESKLGQNIAPSEGYLSQERFPQQQFTSRSDTSSEHTESSKTEMGQPSTPSTGDTGGKPSTSKALSKKPTSSKVEVGKPSVTPSKSEPGQPPSKDEISQHRSPSKSENTTPSKTETGQQMGSSNVNTSKQITPSKTELAQQMTPSKIDLSQQITPSKAEMGQNSTPSRADLSQPLSPSQTEAGQQIAPAKSERSQQMTPSKEIMGEQITPSKADLSKEIIPLKSDTSKQNGDEGPYHPLRQLESASSQLLVEPSDLVERILEEQCCDLQRQLDMIGSGDERQLEKGDISETNISRIASVMAKKCLCECLCDQFQKPETLSDNIESELDMIEAYENSRIFLDSDGTAGDGTKVDVTKGDGSKTGETKGDGTKADAAKSDQTTGNGSKFVGSKSSDLKSDGTKADAAKSDQTTGNESKFVGSKSSDLKSDGTKFEGPVVRITSEGAAPEKRVGNSSGPLDPGGTSDNLQQPGQTEREQPSTLSQIENIGLSRPSSHRNVGGTNSAMKNITSRSPAIRTTTPQVPVPAVHLHPVHSSIRGSGVLDQIAIIGLGATETHGPSQVSSSEETTSDTLILIPVQSVPESEMNIRIPMEEFVLQHTRPVESDISTMGLGVHVNPAASHIKTLDQQSVTASIAALDEQREISPPSPTTNALPLEGLGLTPIIPTQSVQTLWRNNQQGPSAVAPQSSSTASRSVHTTPSDLRDSVLDQLSNVRQQVDALKAELEQARMNQRPHPPSPPGPPDQ